MKNLKTIVISVVSLLIATTAIAQKGDMQRYYGLCGDRAGYMADYLNKELDLTPQQYSSVYGIFLKHEELRNQDFAQYGNDRDQFRDAAQKRKENLDKEMKSVLSPEQFVKFGDIQGKMQKSIKKKFGLQRGNKRGNTLN